MSRDCIYRRIAPVVDTVSLDEMLVSRDIAEMKTFLSRTSRHIA